MTSTAKTAKSSTSSSSSASSSKKAAPVADADVVFPEGLTVKDGDGGSVIIEEKRRELGDIFALSFLAVVVILFASGIGGRLFNLYGVLGALAITLPLWGWLAWAALRRAVNKTVITGSAGKLSIKVGPVGSAGSRALAEGDVASIITRHFENRASTRGGSTMVTKTWSVWAKLKHKGELANVSPDKPGAIGERADEVLIVEPLDDEAQAKLIEKKLTAALRPKKG